MTSERRAIPTTTATDFNADDLRPRGGLLSRLLAPLLEDPQWLFGIFRLLLPIPTFRNWAAVTRYDDVREVLTREAVFEVPFGKKMAELNGGPNFMLGMQDGEDYRRQRQFVMQAFKLEDIPAVAALSAELAERIVAASNGRLDAIADLVTRIPLELCEHYYGVPIPDKRDFAQWVFAISADLFANPFENASCHRAAVAGAERCRAVISDAIAQAKASPGGTTILHRFVELQRAGKGPNDPELLAMMMGMIVGFVPTNTTAGGHILDVLLRRKAFLEAARTAALADDDERLKRCLFEAMRFKPLNFGPFRRCVEDYTVAAGAWRAKTIRKGTNVLASTQSAMFDPRRVRNPHRFDPDRPAADYMLFGHGLHWCVGAFIAEAQITAMFRCLLKKRGLRPADGPDGKLTRLGPFPEHLFVVFDP